MNRTKTLAFVALLTLAACNDDTESWPLDDGLLEQPLLPMPATIGEIGLFAPGGDLSQVAPGVLDYEPNYPLWTNGLIKLRHVKVPPGTSITAGAGEHWEFPLGTLFFKTFAATDADWPGGLRPVETRVMRLHDEGWEFAVYFWDPERGDADLTGPRDIIELEVEDDRGTILHAVPNSLQCRKCHESSITPVIGFSELQFAGQRDFAADALARGLTDRDGFGAADEIEDSDELTQSVLRYFQRDCVHCHNGSDGPASSFDLRADVALANIIDVPTASSGTVAGIRIVPGDPESSVLYQAVRRVSDDPELKFMPLLGVQVVDEESVEELRRWIHSIAEDE